MFKWLCLLVLIATPARAVIYIQNVSSVCATPPTSGVIQEGFLGTGYEQAIWTETIDAAATLNEDYTLTGTPPTGSCSEGMYIDVPTSSGETYIEANETLAAEVDIHVEFLVVSYTLATGEDFKLFTGWTSAWADVASIGLIYDGTELEIYGVGSVDSNAIILQTGTWYTAILHLDATEADSSISLLNSASAETFTRGSGAVENMRFGGIGIESTETLEIQFGRIWTTTP